MSYINNNKFSEAVRYIYDHIDQPISLEKISKQLGISIASLKRLFETSVEQSPGQFIRRLRMELAFRSLQDQKHSILEVALASGFDDQSAFARRFKQAFGYAPSKAREKINIVHELESVDLEEPDIVELDAITVQAVTEQGTYFDAAPRAWQALEAKLSEHELSDDFSGVFIGVGHDNPHDGEVAENKVKFSACVSCLERDIETEQITLKSGHYARFRYVGKPNNLGLAYHYIYGQWEKKSGYKIDGHKPAFIIFTGFPNALTAQIMMIHVPLNQ